MATNMITLKLEKTFLEDVDKAVKIGRYQNRTEFIRNALREKLEEQRIKEAVIELAKLKGASKKITTDKDYEDIRERAFKEIARKFK